MGMCNTWASRQGLVQDSDGWRDAKYHQPWLGILREILGWQQTLILSRSFSCPDRKRLLWCLVYENASNLLGHLWVQRTGDRVRWAAKLRKIPAVGAGRQAIARTVIYSSLTAPGQASNGLQTQRVRRAYFCWRSWWSVQFFVRLRYAFDVSVCCASVPRSYHFSILQSLDLLEWLDTLLRI